MQQARSIGACVVAAALWAAPAAAKPPRACSAAYQGAQESKRAGHLRQARDRLLDCARAACGGLQERCASAAEQVASQLGWIRPVVVDGAGQPLVDVQVKVDGEPLTQHLDGSALPVDPGLHELSFSARVGPWPGREVSRTQKMMVWQGQRGPVSVTLASTDDGDTDAANDAPAKAGDAADDGEKSAGKTPDDGPPRPAPAAPAPAPRGGPSAFASLLGGVGLLGVGAGGLLTYWGKTDNDALAQCSPNCHVASVDHIKRLYLAADLSLAGGGVALGVATLLFATSHSREVPAGSAVAKAARAAYRVDVRPTRSGAFASFEGAF